MVYVHNRLESSFCLGVVLLSLGFVYSCKTAAPPDAREEFVRSLKGANVDGYLFATKEEDHQITTSLTNPTLGNSIKLDSANSLILGYASVKDRKTNATKILKAEVVKAGDAVSLRVTDLGTNDVVLNEIFVPRACPSGGPVFNDQQECFDNFNCTVRPELQCEANRTCRALLFDLECCLKDGAFHALMIVKPTKRICLIAFPFDIDTLVQRP